MLAVNDCFITCSFLLNANRLVSLAQQARLYNGHADHGAIIESLETEDERVLMPRTCFSIEPGIYLEGEFGVRSEIDVYVGEREARDTGGEPQKEVVAYWLERVFREGRNSYEGEASSMRIM